MLTRMVSISWPHDPPALASQSAGITGMSHHTRQRVFSIKRCWILSKAFSASMEIIMWFLSLVLFMWWITFIDVCVEPALHPRDETYLIMMNKLFDVLLRSACQYFIEDFCICVHHGYWPEVFFSCWVSAGFWYQDDVGLIKWFGKDSLFLNCLE